MINNNKTLYNAWNEVIEIFEEYFTIALKAKYKTIHGKGLKMQCLNNASKITSSTCTSKSR